MCRRKWQTGPCSALTGSASSSVLDRGLNDIGAATGHAWPGPTHTFCYLLCRCPHRAATAHHKGNQHSVLHKARCQAQLELQHDTLLCLPHTDNLDALQTGDASQAACPARTCCLGSRPRHAEAVARLFSSLPASVITSASTKRASLMLSSRDWSACLCTGPTDPVSQSTSTCWPGSRPHLPRQADQTHLLAWQRAPSC